MGDPHGQPGRLRLLITTLPALALLLLLVAHWTATRASGQLIALGEATWTGYAADLRRDLPAPEPPPGASGADDVGVPSHSPETDDDLIGELLGGDEAAPDDALIGELLGGDEAAPDDALIGELLGGDEAAPDDALIGELLGEAPVAVPVAPDPERVYEDALAVWDAREARLTRPVRTYRTVDRAVSAFASWGSDHVKHALVFLVLLCGGAATSARSHIALRPVGSRLDARVADLSTAVASLLVTASCVLQWRSNASSGVEVFDQDLLFLWGLAFGTISAVALGRLAMPGPVPTGGTIRQAALAVPLFASMTFIASGWFLIVEQYPQGLAVYLLKLAEHAQLYVFVGLYVWAGMLLKRTRIAHAAFGLIRPFRLGPELLAVVIVVGAALPTAYSGASGIFVIAVGALVYDELIRAGARPQLALATTAMSGSLGVVLRPCLLVVIVAYLNPPTTDVLYGWGKWVFILSASLFAVAVLLTRDGPLVRRSPLEALPEALAGLRGMAGYAALFAGVVAVFWLGLDTSLDEHSAPVLLPVVLLLAMWAEGWAVRSDTPASDDDTPTLLDATSETTLHVGALLLLMGLSIAVGGVFERSEIMTLVPADLGARWLTMAMLVVVLVIIGMTMDPYGAVILVSATIAQIAYEAGINDAHFWMVVLVSFELGYLTPPVALNHLLTRQVVGTEAFEHAIASSQDEGFWRRHERLLLPLSVMGTVLVIVAFVPLAFV
jgi:TRAP-type C4-dicarboxylate transport system permease large subunit